MKDNIREWFQATILGIAVLFSLISMFEFDIWTNLFGFLIAIYLGAMYLVTSEKVKTKLKFVNIGILLLISIICLPYAFEGIKVLLNQICQTFGRNAGFPYVKYKVNLVENEYYIAMCMVFLYISIGIALLCYLVEKSRKYILLFCIITFFIAISGFHIVPSIESGIFLLVAIGVHLNKKVSSILLYPLLVVIMVGIISFGLLDEGKSIYRVHDEVMYTWNNIRFGSNKPGMLPEGNLSELKPLQLSEKVALKIVMNQPTSYYLRGFVGSEFYQNRWHKVNNNDYYESYNLFYWLHKDGFSPLEQLFTVANRLEQQDEILGKVNVQYASKQYNYYPYEAVVSKKQTDKSIACVDSNIMSNRLFGEDVYTFNACPNLTKNYQQLQREYNKTLEGNISENDTYVNDERNYREFVMKTYTKIDNEERKILERVLGKIDNSGEKKSCKEVMNTIKVFLEKNMIYDTKVEDTIGKHDIISYLLEYSNRGYSIHYATLATLLYRYYGIPARYVEGYLITPKDIKYTKAYEEIAIHGFNAHAWVEIYQDGIGWVPVEHTPPYYDVMEHLTDLGVNGVENQTKQTMSSKEEETIQQHENQDEYVYFHKEKKNLHRAMFIIGSIVLIVIVISFVAYYSIRRYRLKRRLQLANRNLAVQNLFPVIMKRLYKRGIHKQIGSLYAYEADVEAIFSKEFSNHYIQVIDIIQKAIFSDIIITEEEYSIVMNFYKMCCRRRKHENY
jgi:protein-glutamine gamma-glutamyltransferase